MGKFLNKIVENNILFVGVLIVLLIILVTLIILIIRSIRDNKKINVYEEDLEDEDFKKVKNVKKEDIIESPDKEEIKYNKSIDNSKNKVEERKKDINFDELEQRYSEEKKREFEEVKNNQHDSELEKIISKMEEDSKLKPEEVVANFEKEQEAKSIISYKELVNAVKSRTDDYDDELESRPLDTVSNLMDEFENNQYESEKKDEEVVNDTEDRKFRNTDVISPVFGIVGGNNKIEEKKIDNPKRIDIDNTIDMQKTIDLSHSDLSDFDFLDTKHEKNIDSSKESITALDEIYRQMATDLKDDEVESNSKKINQNEEFLQSLKDFRSKL